jgi:hypothetical protein
MSRIGLAYTYNKPPPHQSIPLLAVRYSLTDGLRSQAIRKIDMARLLRIFSGLFALLSASQL